MRPRVLIGAVPALAILAVTVSAFASPARQEATTRVTVNMSEYKFALSKRSVPRGTVVFRVANKGTIGHNFRIGGKKTRVLAAGASGSLTVALPRAGRYAYVCTLPSHAAAGMKGTLTVR